MRKAFWKNEEGFIAVVVGIMLTVLFGFIALSVDIGNLYFVRTRLQNTVDAAVCAGGLSLPNTASATSQANYFINRNNTSNGFTSANATITFNQDIYGKNPKNYPEINCSLTYNAPTYFMGLFRYPTVPIQVVAEAILIDGTVGGVFNYAVFSNQNIVLSGTNIITGSVHTNNDLIFSGSNTITGTAECSTAIGSGGQNIGTLVQNTSTMQMPDLSSQIEAIAQAQGTVYSGSKTLSGTTNITGDIYINGSLTISGTITGTGAILATGNITTSGSLNVSGGNQIALYSSTGNITTSGSVTNGTGSSILYAPHGEVIYSGSMTINGGIIANQITGSGALTVNGGVPVTSLPGGKNHVQLIE
ncbi:MAG: pilus assembly protein TadG-related protein [Dehalococcoidales bacterium]